MIGVSGPSRRVLVSLIAPSRPALPGTTRKQFNERTRAARFDQIVLFVWLA